MALHFASVSTLMLVIIVSVQGSPSCVCPRRLAPVCGSDGQVYPNACVLDCTQSILKKDLKIVKDGACEPAMNPQPCICTDDLTPVCGTDGVTYSNVCLLRCERSKQPELEVEHRGKCGGRTKRDNVYALRYNVRRRTPCSSE